MASTDDLSPEESDVGEKRIDRKRIGPKHSKDNTQREYSGKRIPVSYHSLLLIREICPTR